MVIDVDDHGFVPAVLFVLRLAVLERAVHDRDDDGRHHVSIPQPDMTETAQTRVALRYFLLGLACGAPNLIYKMIHLMYVGRGDADSFSDNLGRSVRKNAAGDCAAMMAAKSPLAEYLAHGLVLAIEQGVDFEAEFLTTTVEPSGQNARLAQTNEDAWWLTNKLRTVVARLRDLQSRLPKQRAELAATIADHVEKIADIHHPDRLPSFKLDETTD